MKPQIILSTLGSLVVSAVIACAQDSATPAESANNPQPLTAAPSEVVASEAAILLADNHAETPAPVAAADAKPEAAPAEAEATSEVIPLIVIDDTPLLDAIRNLARQAGINLIVDPKVAYGQVGPDGKTTPQPNVSIRWENITASQAFNALLNNYDLQAVEDPKVKITRVTIKDPAAPDPLVTKTIQLQYAGPSNVIAAVTASFTDKRSKVVADVRTSQLVVVTTEKELLAIEKLITQLDTPTKQVLIEARLVETSLTPSTIKGIDWTGTFGAQRVAFGNNLSPEFPTATLSVNDTLPSVAPGLMAGTSPTRALSGTFLDADGVRAVLSFLNTDSETKILSSPRTVTLDNETALIEVGTLFPVINVTAGTANTTGGSQINYSNLTVRLDVTPRISANNTINLKVVPQVMRLDRVQTFDVGEGTFDVPIFATRHLATSVLIPSGNTLVMGGLIQDNTTRGNVKVPVLGDIPGLGMMFRRESKTRDKGNLIVFITPTIVQDQDFQPTTSNYLKTPVPSEDSVEPEWNAWDSAKPVDWSKPRAQK